MTAMKNILDRLSGIHPVREKLEGLGSRVKKLSDLLLDHEKHLVRMETQREGTKARKYEGKTHASQPPVGIAFSIKTFTAHFDD